MDSINQWFFIIEIEPVYPVWFRFLIPVLGIAGAVIAWFRFRRFRGRNSP